jgi:hypothetical protein
VSAENISAQFDNVVVLREAVRHILAAKPSNIGKFLRLSSTFAVSERFSMGNLLSQYTTLELLRPLCTDSMSSNMKVNYAFEVWVKTQSIQDTHLRL